MKKNNITKAEYLSSVLDDEAGTFEQRRILKELQQDDSMLSKVGNYSLIGEVLRNEEIPHVVQSNFLAGIQDKIANEETYDKTHITTNKNKLLNKSWHKPIVGMGMAAGLATIAIMSFSLISPPEPLQQQVDQSEGVNMIATTDEVDITTSSDPKVWREITKSYVEQHSKNAPSAMSSVRFVSYSSSY
ncbi:MAG: sigma-E factor negative regulatory protein [Thiotrichaceae bacterium]|nr:sigma-E factor negative regulatory protein [Thiotrichaceae bacterium]